MLADTVLICLSVVLALYLRLGEAPTATALKFALPTALACATPVFVTMGLYRVIFRYSSWPALAMVLRAVTVGSIPFLAVVTMVGLPGVPRTIGIIHPILLLLLVSASRATAHAFLAHPYAEMRQERARCRVLIYGAGSAGLQLLAGLRQNNEFAVVGFIDDDRMLIGERLHGLRIYAARDLGSIFEELGVTDILLALPSTSRARRAEIISEIKRYPIHVRTIPGMTDIALGNVDITDIRDLDIADLLGRGSIPPEEALLARNVAGKIIAVTGAGGSIGSELCRQMLHLRPDRLLLIDNSEYALYAVHQELERLKIGLQNGQPELIPILASVTDHIRMDGIFGHWHPDTVYHAAAYKHVPLVEANVVEGVINNVFGTLIVADVAAKHRAENFILISTDKAVRPTNVMGATKRLSEMVLQALAENSDRTCFAMVRFGNVLNSSGSVVPLFRQQIRDGGPVTVTHREVVRYFMTIPEAAQLVVQASAMANGGEVFVLDMGEPVKIVDLARNMIELSGLIVRDEKNLDGDIEIAIVGLRAGEKLYEELLIGENPEKTNHPRILKANEAFLPWESLEPFLERLRAKATGQDEAASLALLKELVPEFAPEKALVPKEPRLPNRLITRA